MPGEALSLLELVPNHLGFDAITCCDGDCPVLTGQSRCRDVEPQMGADVVLRHSLSVQISPPERQKAPSVALLS